MKYLGLFKVDNNARGEFKYFFPMTASILFNSPDGSKYSLKSVCSITLAVKNVCPIVWHFFFEAANHPITPSPWAKRKWVSRLLLTKTTPSYSCFSSRNPGNQLGSSQLRDSLILFAHLLKNRTSRHIAPSGKQIKGSPGCNSRYV